MNNLEQWQHNNEQYLSKALTWLRLCLKRQVQKIEQEKETCIETLPTKHRFLGRNFLPALPPGNNLITDEKIAAAAREMSRAETLSPPPAMVILSQRLGLSPFEQKLLLLCAAIELDTSIGALCARAQDNPHQNYPTFALAFTLFEDASWDILSPERPLRYWRLLEINQPGAQPLTTSSLRIDERILNYLKGLNYLDDRLVSLVSPLDSKNTEYQLPLSHQKAVEAITSNLQPYQTPLVIQLLGSDSASKQLVAQQAAQSIGLFVYRLSIELLPTTGADLETFIRLWERESLLLPIILYLDAQEITTSTEAQNAHLYRFLNRINSLLFLSSREIHFNNARSTIPIDIDKPTPDEQKQLWERALGKMAGEIPAQIASQFNLNLPTIYQITQTVLNTPNNNLYNQLWSTCLAHTRPQLDILAQRINSKATWENIVLPSEETSLLQQIADQVKQRSKVYQEWGFENRMNRGLGISALFAGESGTGKTMAAEVIANELRLNLYRIDLSAVVSKYIGETEKNLRRLFDAAEDGGAILFFDEADALFGKRSEVKDSHDRYANIEINYLLQRMEAFRGLAILATNMRNALDNAFVRRLRFIVNFQFPNPSERQKIWQKVFPKEVPTENLDFARLARLNLTGGSIHNIALNAAFLAAQKGTGVTMPLVLQSARAEFRKLDRPINEIDFRYSEPVGAPR
ncbi:ATPase [Dulcicalothrix desertica PCC 7102]|uniref:ATPase n=1 Tax=Dulcicalothrix desertica PCC 7102 TaxID=232991 RepID=A0A3S1B0J7_9CYAN|nr:ATP-binding protein [Dulcicalothrix desertica]RUT02462.1 ATPase [Dulcicalothrix desertica PCC 7102]TWH55320.1 ATPases of the AAA+ class [Dulcicalothrix desertica PCC 7102]